MKLHLKLEVCAFFVDEFRAALVAEKHGDIELVPVQGACDERRRPARTEAPLVQSNSPTLRLMGVCSGAACSNGHARYAAPDDGIRSAGSVNAPHSCFELLLGPDKVDALLGAGAHLLTPAMVRAYPETLQCLNEKPENLHAYFAESVHLWVVVDTGVAPLTAAEQAAFLATTGGKMELLPAELHLLRANLRAALAQEEVDAVKADTGKQIASLQHCLADYTMAYDLISRLIPHQGEQNIANAILELFYLLCAPHAAHLLLVQDEDATEGAVQFFSQPAGSGNKERLRAFLHSPVPWGEIKTPQGFYFQIHQENANTPLGAVVVEGTFLPEQQRNYLDVARLLMPILRLALHNARSYEKLCGTERELRASQMALEQRVAERTAQLTAEIAVRKQSEQALREAEARFRSSFEAAAIGMALVSTEGRFIDANSSLCQLIGYPLAELTQKTFQEITYPDDLEVDLSYAKQLMAGERASYQMEKRYSHKDGHIVWALLTGSTVRDTRGKLLYFVAQIQDITERKRVEQSLQESEARFRNLVETVNDWIWEIDEKAVYTYASPRIADILGYETAEIIGKTPFDLMPPEEAQRVASIFNRMVVGRTPFKNIENTNLHKDGHPVTLETCGIPVVDAAGNYRGYRGIDRDITERKRMEEALLRKTEEIEAFFRTALDLLCIASTDGYFLRLNPEWEKTLGYTLGELEGKRFLDFVHPEDMGATLHALSDLSEQKPVINFTNRYLRKDGTYRWIEWRSRPAGKLVYAAARDITERKEFEAELKRSNIELEHFSYAISHDMRQPLRMISSYLQLLEMSLSGQLDSEKRSYLDFAVDGAKRIDQMLVALLEYSRAGRMGEPPAWIDSRAVLDEAQKFIQSSLDEAQAKLSITGDWPRIFARHDEIQRLLQNLVGNAVKFRVAGRIPEIAITGKVVENEWRLCITDNGVGIIPDQIKRLFQVFQRLHSREAYEGTGIGLALCRKIAEHHKGRIWAESASEGKGSKFCVVLPVLREKT